MKAYELRELSDAELQKRILDEEENLANLRFQRVITQLENPMKLRIVRKDIAKMKTILRERQLKSGTTKEREAESKASVAKLPPPSTEQAENT